MATTAFPIFLRPLPTFLRPLPASLPVGFTIFLPVNLAAAAVPRATPRAAAVTRVTLAVFAAVLATVRPTLFAAPFSFLRKPTSVPDIVVIAQPPGVFAIS